MKTSPLLLAALVASATASADDVFLKGGGKISGRILQKTDTSIEIEVGAGKIAVPASRVEKIVEGRSALEDYQRRAGALAASDRDGWMALGRWASDQGLPSQSREAYQRVLAIDPSDAEANAALGNMQVGGLWMSEEESYKARGFVKYDGQWMTPAEQASLERERAADSERARAAAENRARQAEARAEDAEARAKEAEAAQQQQEGIPLYWGWGPGPVLWPTQPVVPNRPATLPARVR
jgi:hypothetical protein